MGRHEIDSCDVTQKDTMMPSFLTLGSSAVLLLPGGIISQTCFIKLKEKEFQSLNSQRELNQFNSKKNKNLENKCDLIRVRSDQDNKIDRLMIWCRVQKCLNKMLNDDQKPLVNTRTCDLIFFFLKE